jgi:hypothetical protein
MPTLYLHVGPHKTGSTYLQAEFTDQWKALLSQGVLYPETGREFLRGHHNIAWFFKGRQLINIQRPVLHERLMTLANSESEKILLSSENFMRLADTDLKELRSYFPRYDFHTIYFQRRDPKFFLSLWNETIKHGSISPLNETDLDSLAASYAYNPFDHDENIFRLKAGLGGEVTSFDYTEMRSQGANILDVVCDLLKVRLNSIVKTVNPSLPIETLELIRAANIYSKGLGYPRSIHPRQHCFTLLKAWNGWTLRNYIKEKSAALSQELPVEYLKQIGFPFPINGHEMKPENIKFIPGNLFFDELEKDDFIGWQKLKMMIREGGANAEKNSR